MLNIQWQEQELPIRRLIVRLGHERSFDNFVEQLAVRHHLAVAEETVVPQSGDFWLGTHPRTGWADSDPNSIAWSSIVELPLAGC